MLKYKHNKLLLTISSSLLASSLYASGFTTEVEYPLLKSGNILSPIFTNSQQYLFYSGINKNSDYVSGYFDSCSVLEHDFTPHITHDYHNHKPKSILSATKNSNDDIFVLSYIEGMGQMISGKFNNDKSTWHNVKLNKPNNYFDKLTNTNTYGKELLVSYSNNKAIFYSSNNLSQWGMWAFPELCHHLDNCTHNIEANNSNHCSYTNQYFGSNNNKYVLLQSYSVHGKNINKLYTNSDFENWYHEKSPFENLYIEKAMQVKYDTLAVATIDLKKDLEKDLENNHNLWLSPNLKDWYSFNLPNNAIFKDVNISDNNKVYVLLGYKDLNNNNIKHPVGCPCGKDHNTPDDTNDDTNDDNKDNYKNISELVYLEPETHNLKLVARFQGSVNKISFNKGKMYLSGDFYNYNQDNGQNSHVALVSAEL